MKKLSNLIFHRLYLLNWHMGHHFGQFCNMSILKRGKQLFFAKIEIMFSVLDF